VNFIIDWDPPAVGTSTLPWYLNPVRVAEPAVSTAVELAATRPEDAEACFCGALVAVPEGLGLPLPDGDGPASAEGGADAGPEDPGEAVGWPGEVGLGEEDGAPAVGVGVGVGDGEPLGRQMMPRMHP
jgi:hypothetical protein